MRARAAVAVFLLSAIGCRFEETLRLPEEPDADLAFAILYGPADRIERIGAVVPRQTVYGAEYAIGADDGDLVARLYFVSSADVVSAAEARCDEREDAADRIRCRAGAASCAEDPVSCLQPVARGTSCGERLPLPDTMPVLAYEAGAGGRMVPYAGSAALPLGATLCGPRTDPACANFVAGFIAFSPNTEGGAVACVVAVEQVECMVALDLSSCALPPVTAEVTAEGTLENVDGSCTITPDGGGFTVRCGEVERRLVRMTRALGSADCRQSGPGVFNTRAPSPGRISGGLVYAPAGWEPRDVLVGHGVDDCAVAGCDLSGQSCDSSCIDLCAVRFDLTECAEDGWDACAPTSQLDDCLTRCRTWCGLDSGETCYTDTYGDMLTVTRPDAPEHAISRVVLGDARRWGATGNRAIARLGRDLLVAVTRDRLHVLAPDGTDRLEAVVEPAPLDFEIAGVIADAATRDAFVFGARGGEPRAAIAHFAWRGEAPALVATSSAIDTLPSFDVAALGGREDASLFAASADPARRSIAVIGRDAVTAIRRTIDAGGRIVDLAALPGGHVMAAVDRDDGSSALVVLDEDEVLLTIDVWPGLAARALAPEPSSCATGAATCRVFVGFELTRRVGAALIGQVDYSPAAPTSTRLVEALVPLHTQQVDLLLVDSTAERVLSIAGRRNAMTSVRLH